MSEYGCFMVKVSIDGFEAIQDNIDENDLNLDEGGFETDSHITLKYGVAGDPSLQKLVDTLYKMEGIKPEKFAYKGLTLFSNETRDVLKFDVVVDEELLSMRKAVESEFDCSGDEHPEYHPHITVAFLKPGAGEKYVNPNLEGSITTLGLTYSSAERKYKLNLG